MRPFFPLNRTAVEPDSNHRVRFNTFELDLNNRELRRNGRRLKLQGQPIEVLAMLLERPGEVVTREQLRHRLWPEDTFVDFEHSVNSTVRRLREALGDSSENPRFVETLPRRGYRFIAPVGGWPGNGFKAAPLPNGAAVVPADNAVTAVSPAIDGRVPHSGRRHWLVVALATIAVLLIVLLIAWWRMPPAVPVVESVVQLTDDGQPKDSMVSDGSRIYFNEGTDLSGKIAQVSVHGGPTAPVETRVPRPFLTGISRDGSALLVVARPTGWPFYGGPLWWVPLPAGEPRRLGSFDARYADIFPDGRIVFGQSIQGKDPKGTDSDAEIFITDKDDSNPQKLLSFPGIIGDTLSVSPDGQRILFAHNRWPTPENPVHDGSVFEIAANGTRLREIREVSGNECCFAWTPDAKYLAYMSWNGEQSNIWLLPLQTGLFRRMGAPIRLTNGPLPYSLPYLSRDGKQIFVLGTKERGELARYDMKAGAFVPFLSGISATDPTFSRDGKWVAYASYPDRSLWRSRTDGSERMQLTFPPTEVRFPAISPDGTKVAFHNGNGDLFVISMEGGTPQKIRDNAIYATWSPDGNYLFFGHFLPPYQIEITDLRTGQNSTIPNPKDFASGFWLNQNTLVVRNRQNNNFVTFNLKTRAWADLTPGALGDIEHWIASPDDKYIYFTTAGAEPKVMRIRVGDRQLETITSLKDFHRAASPGAQINIAPDGSPIFTRDTGYQEIYALNIRWP